MSLLRCSGIYIEMVRNTINLELYAIEEKLRNILRRVKNPDKHAVLKEAFYNIRGAQEWR